jgi:hypothetical protein
MTTKRRKSPPSKRFDCIAACWGLFYWRRLTAAITVGVKVQQTDAVNHNTAMAYNAGSHVVSETRARCGFAFFCPSWVAFSFSVADFISSGLNKFFFAFLRVLRILLLTTRDHGRKIKGMSDELELLYADAKSRLEEAKADLEALERVRRMRSRPSTNGRSDHDDDHEDHGRATRGHVKRAIRDFIAGVHGTFTMLDVYKALEDAGAIVPKKQSVKAALGVLERTGEIETVTRGIGRKPSVYRIAKQVK